MLLRLLVVLALHVVADAEGSLRIQTDKDGKPYVAKEDGSRHVPEEAKDVAQKQDDNRKNVEEDKEDLDREKENENEKLKQKHFKEQKKKEAEETKRLAERAKKHEIAFFAANKARAGVVALKSGLQYKVLTKGTGKLSPKAEARVKMWYIGTTLKLTPKAIDWAESRWDSFTDSNETDKEKPQGTPDMKAKDFIKGFSEGLMKMVEGDLYELYIPAHLGYGDAGHSSNGTDYILPGDTLIFRIQLKKVKGSAEELVRTRFCDVATREYCEPEENATLTEWIDKPLDDIDAEFRSAREKALSPKTEEDKVKYTLQEGVLKRLLGKRRKMLDDEITKKWMGQPRDAVEARVKELNEKMKGVMPKGDFEPAKATLNVLRRMMKSFSRPEL